MLLSITLFLPLVGALALAMVDDDRSAKVVALGATLLTFVASVALALQFDSGNPDLQLAVNAVREGRAPAVLAGTLARDALKICHAEAKSIASGRAVAV